MRPVDDGPGSAHAGRRTLRRWFLPVFRTVRRGFTALLLGTLLPGACATNRPPKPAVSRLPGVICTMETPIGSHRPKQVCRSSAEVKADRKQARQALDSVRNTPNRTVPGQ